MQGGYSGFQVTGMMEWEKKSKPKKIPRASNKTQKIPGPKFNPPKSHAEFLNHKNFQKALHETLVLNTNPPPLPKEKYLPKFSHPKKSFDHPCHLKSRVHPLEATVT